MKLIVVGENTLLNLGLSKSLIDNEKTELIDMYNSFNQFHLEVETQKKYDFDGIIIDGAHSDFICAKKFLTSFDSHYSGKLIALLHRGIQDLSSIELMRNKILFYNISGSVAVLVNIMMNESEK